MENDKKLQSRYERVHTSKKRHKTIFLTLIWYWQTWKNSPRPNKINRETVEISEKKIMEASMGEWNWENGF